MMELGRSFFHLRFHVCEAQVQSGREQGCLWKSFFGLGTGTRVQIRLELCLVAEKIRGRQRETTRKNEACLIRGRRETPLS